MPDVRHLTLPYQYVAAVRLPGVALGFSALESDRTGSREPSGTHSGTHSGTGKQRSTRNLLSLCRKSA